MLRSIDKWLRAPLTRAWIRQPQLQQPSGVVAVGDAQRDASPRGSRGGPPVQRRFPPGR